MKSSRFSEEAPWRRETPCRTVQYAKEVHKTSRDSDLFAPDSRPRSGKCVTRPQRHLSGTSHNMARSTNRIRGRGLTCSFTRAHQSYRPPTVRDGGVGANECVDPLHHSPGNPPGRIPHPPVAHTYIAAVSRGRDAPKPLLIPARAWRRIKGRTPGREDADSGSVPPEGGGQNSLVV